MFLHVSCFYLKSKWPPACCLPIWPLFGWGQLLHFLEELDPGLGSGGSRHWTETSFQRCVPFAWNALICSWFFSLQVYTEYHQFLFSDFAACLQLSHDQLKKNIPSQQQCRKSTSRLLGAKSTSRKCSARTKPSLRPRSWTTPNTVSDMSSLWLTFCLPGTDINLKTIKNTKKCKNMQGKMQKKYKVFFHKLKKCTFTKCIGPMTSWANAWKKNWLHNIIPWPQNEKQLMCQSEMLELPNQEPPYNFPSHHVLALLIQKEVSEACLCSSQVPISRNQNSEKKANQQKGNR